MQGFPDFSTLERSSNPNDCLVAPEHLCTANLDFVAPVFDETPAQLFGAVKSLLEQDDGYGQVKADEKEASIWAVAVTRIMRFKDDVYIKILPVLNGATLAIYSHSRVGNGDLGANRKRVVRLLEALQ